jgi:hypothetical protein
MSHEEIVREIEEGLDAVIARLTSERDEARSERDEAVSALRGMDSMIEKVVDVAHAAFKQRRVEVHISAILDAIEGWEENKQAKVDSTAGAPYNNDNQSEGR